MVPNQDQPRQGQTARVSAGSKGSLGEIPVYSAGVYPVLIISVI